MTEPDTSATIFKSTMRRLARPLALTRLGMLAERVARAFWPLWSLSIALLALLMLGVQDMVRVELVWAIGAAGLVGAIGAAIWGAWRFRWPARQDAEARLDASLPGRPIQTLRDSQAIGAGDAGSTALWQAHQRRMAERAAVARAVDPDLRVSSRDPYGLRYIALTALVVAGLFGSFWRVGSVAGMAPGGAALAAGPSWEGWVEPPVYTGLPVLYLADQDGVIQAPVGSRVTLRLYGEVGALSVDQTVAPAQADSTAPNQSLILEQAGDLAISGPGGRSWQVSLLADTPPVVALSDKAEASVEGEMRMPFSARDDFGIERGEAVIRLDLAAVDRRHGLALEPETRPEIRLPMPLPIAGDRSDFSENLIENFSEHAWANLPVIVSISAVDAAEQVGQSAPFATRLAARRFFDPLAGAIVELRRDLLWNRANARRIVRLMRAVSWEPEGLFRKETAYLRFRVLMRRLDTISSYAPLTDDQVSDFAQGMWDLALLIEEGDLEDARERMKRAQERLNEAMKNGASPGEIARLMQELRDATQDYLRQLSRQQGEDGETGEEMTAEQMENALQLNQDDIQRMMDRIQELMEQGKMAEAQQAMEELQKLLENMRVTQGQGNGQQSPGERAMEDLAETLRDQQGLSDEAFRDLQEQFNPDANRGESQQNQGRNGGQGSGQSHEGQNGQQGQNGESGSQEGQQGQSQGQHQGQQNGGSGDGSEPGDLEGDLAGRQQALRDELGRQRGNLPGAGTEAGRSARDALDRAEEAMRGAEEALRQDDLAEAIDRQSEAMEALREGMRNLGEAMAEEQRQMRGEQGQAQGENSGERNDPLGRNAGSGGTVGDQNEMLKGEDVYRRALELEEELRRRSGESERPEIERDYLKRLLERY